MSSEIYTSWKPKYIHPLSKNNYFVCWKLGENYLLRYGHLKQTIIQENENSLRETMSFCSIINHDIITYTMKPLFKNCVTLCHVQKLFIGNGAIGTQYLQKQNMIKSLSSFENNRSPFVWCYYKILNVFCGSSYKGGRNAPPRLEA